MRISSMQAARRLRAAPAPSCGRAYHCRHYRAMTRTGDTPPVDESPPVKAGKARAEVRWISVRRRVLVADAHIVDASGEEVARGTGTFMRSRISLSSLPSYGAAG